MYRLHCHGSSTPTSTLASTTVRACCYSRWPLQRHRQQTPASRHKIQISHCRGAHHWIRPSRSWAAGGVGFFSTPLRGWMGGGASRTSPSLSWCMLCVRMLWTGAAPLPAWPQQGVGVVWTGEPARPRPLFFGVCVRRRQSDGVVRVSRRPRAWQMETDGLL